MTTRQQAEAMRRLLLSNMESRRGFRRDMIDDETKAEWDQEWDDLIAAVLEAERPKWTSEKPEEEGEYWFRSPVCKPITASVWRDNENHLVAQIGCNEHDLDDVDVFNEYEDGEWSGPIPQPEEGK